MRRVVVAARGQRAGALTPVAAVALAVLAAAFVGACGLNVRLADLFLVTRSGGGAKLRLVVNESGGVRCNGGRQKTLTSSQLITARDLSENLADDAKAKLTIPVPPNAVYSYTVKLQQGTISFPDRAATTHRYLGQLEAFVLQIAPQYCA